MARTHHELKLIQEYKEIGQAKCRAKKLDIDYSIEDDFEVK